MSRPCFLVVDREYVGSISTRKLVIETAKLNVITAYSSREAIEMLARFPNVDGIVMDAGMPDMPCSELVQRLKAMQPGKPIVIIGTPRQVRCDGADEYMEAFEPTRLLDKLRHIIPGAQEVLEQEQQTSYEMDRGLSSGLVR